MGFYMMAESRIVEDGAPLAEPQMPKRNFLLAHLVNTTVMTFDPAGQENNSLYICSSDPNSPSVGLLIALLMKENLWSNQYPTQVPDIQKAAYEAQLNLVEVRKLECTGLARRISFWRDVPTLSIPLTRSVGMPGTQQHKLFWI